MDWRLIMKAIRQKLKKDNSIKAVYSSKKGIAGLPRVFINGVETPAERVGREFIKAALKGEAERIDREFMREA